MPKTYPTFDLAQRRVDNLKKQGLWPGIIGPDTSGFYRLTWDPGDEGGDR